MSSAICTDLIIHADTRKKRRLLADLLGCFGFEYPDMMDFKDAGLNLIQEDRGYVEHLLPAVDAICRALAAHDLNDLVFSIDGNTDCDYGVYTVFEIQMHDGKAYCRDTELDTNELDPEEEDFDLDDPLADALENASEALSECGWTEVAEHEAVRNPLCLPFEEDQIQKADEIISAYLCSQ